MWRIVTQIYVVFIVTLELAHQLTASVSTGLVTELHLVIKMKNIVFLLENNKTRIFDS